MTLFFSLVFSLWLVARSGDSPEGVPLIFVVFCFVSGCVLCPSRNKRPMLTLECSVNAIVLFVFDLIILAHDKAFEVKHKFETTQNTDQNA